MDITTHLVRVFTAVALLYFITTESICSVDQKNSKCHYLSGQTTPLILFNVSHGVVAMGSPGHTLNNNWNYYHNHYCQWIITCSNNAIVYVKSNLYPNTNSIDVNACATTSTHGDYVKVKVGTTMDDTICDKGPHQGYYYKHVQSNVLTIEFNSDSANSNNIGMYAIVHDVAFGSKRKRDDNPSQLSQVEEMLVDVAANDNARFYCGKSWARPYVDQGCTCSGIDVKDQGVTRSHK
ncbi:uncharacterized protein LOC134178727 [Corticium candelabrum]|uniref:uncharacterized protein LOC134178727 n=1 Tax=Corticium candelabrum TaxID=121492 RepID=UPI002E2673A1|nr:uncharacterized protein LOC134178727 [Corticium candelabrum]